MSSKQGKDLQEGILFLWSLYQMLANNKQITNCFTESILILPNCLSWPSTPADKTQSTLHSPSHPGPDCLLKATQVLGFLSACSQKLLTPCSRIVFQYFNSSLSTLFCDLRCQPREKGPSSAPVTAAPFSMKVTCKQNHFLFLTETPHKRSACHKT